MEVRDVIIDYTKDTIIVELKTYYTTELVKFCTMLIDDGFIKVNEL